MRQESQLFKQIAGNTVRVENTQTYVLNYDFTQLIFAIFAWLSARLGSEQAGL